MMFKFSIVLNGVYLLVLIVFIKDIVASLATFEVNKERVTAQYQMTLSLIVRYRFTHNILVSMRNIECNAKELPLLEFERGDFDFKKLALIHTHYSWKTLISVLAVDIIHGDQGIDDKLYDLEAEVDYWYDAVNGYSERLIQTVKMLVLLSSISILVTYFVCEMLLQATQRLMLPNYEILLFIFLVLINSFVCVVFRILRHDLTLRREHVC